MVYTVCHSICTFWTKFPMELPLHLILWVITANILLSESSLWNYRKFRNFRTLENFAVIYPKFKQRGQALGYFVKMMQMKLQTVKILIGLEEQSNLGLLCLARPICPKTLGHYGTTSFDIWVNTANILLSES